MAEVGRSPRVLVAATGCWVSTARLALALHGFGCRVSLMSLEGHPARVLKIFEEIFRYNPLRPMASIRRALQGNPEFVVPADELALLHLGEIRSEFEGLLERSVGRAGVFEAAESRTVLLGIAEDQGVGAPESAAIAAERDVPSAVKRFGFPLVLKADATSGGQGVRVVESEREARRAWGLLHEPPSLVRVLKRGIVGKEWTHVRPWAQRTRRGVSAQRFVAGRERTGMVVCLRGDVKASVCLEVMEHWCERGPSSVVRVVEDAEMEAAMRKVASHVGVSGFCGFDFIVDPVTERPLLIEMNPRPTQLVHLALGPGKDLAAAYVREVLGLSEIADRVAVTEGDRVAVFPQEVQRDPESEVLRTIYHDVPWEFPELVRRVLPAVPKVLTEDARWRGDKVAKAIGTLTTVERR